jgi:hypothetical protein
MPNKIYRAVETAVTFTDTTGTYALVLNSLAASTGRCSIGVDRGAGSLPVRYKWKAIIQWNVAPVLGDAADIYIIESDGTYVDGVANLTTGATFTLGQSLNMKQIGAVRAQSATATTNFIASGVCNIYERYYGVGVFNRSAQILENTNNVSLVILTPMPDEIQD